MNKEYPYRDQAERTRKKLERKEEIRTDREELPPRNEVHRKKNGSKNSWKIQYPIIRLLVLFFILLPITIYSAYNYLNGINEKVNIHPIKSSGYEKISIENDLDHSNHNQVENSLLPEAKNLTESIEPAPLTEGNEMYESKGSLQSNQLKEIDSRDAVEKKEVSVPAAPNIQGSETEDRERKVEETHAEEVIYHTVKKGENLFRISLKYYRSQEGMELIQKKNNLNGDNVQAGQVLIIPLLD
ncbi:LysM peptidoglycan-binding domain-containing protein [Bacillus sp. B15-48]|uniref:LysM peptidoglycan-binding domain-containing protein n=1 Tax=Bacillus sp. B15-48 TaxID=1548601 RepID=UPI00193F3E98|nr:LysM peptidoglycan-binding domain-containing protein [Bacillus sp. B15-48]MBM4762154.1 LysM peptidoglycan-binding domain-containing protein [Bacillus sp. B15-48]